MNAILLWAALLSAIVAKCSFASPFQDGIDLTDVGSRRVLDSEIQERELDGAAVRKNELSNDGQVSLENLPYKYDNGELYSLYEDWKKDQPSGKSGFEDYLEWLRTAEHSRELRELLQQPLTAHESLLVRSEIPKPQKRGICCSVACVLWVICGVKCKTGC